MECVLTIMLLMKTAATITTPTTKVYTACNHLPDGVAYILPYGDFSSSNHPLLPVTCSGGNTILDASLSFATYREYFSSLYMYDIGIGGPELNDFSSWRQWFLPEISDEEKANFIYGVSEDCTSSCVYNADEFNSASAYYMTGNFFLCAWITKGDCDMDSDTYQCYQCARKGGRSTDILPGVCSHLEYSVDETVHSDHFECTGNNDNVKPAIGLMHEYCVCYKPNDAMVASITMDTADFEENTPPITDETASTSMDDDVDASSNIVYLSSRDFLYGTYRITEAGTYIFTEDVWFNFNAPTDTDRNIDAFSPNSYEDLWWMPRSDGSQEEKYQGGSTWSGPYQLGFFTGIAVECSNVIIDLNGHSVGMSEEFYLQQRFFSIIELATKNFVSGQGPVDFGPYLNSASNVVIRNGVLNRASHHCIHGNGASAVVIDNIRARNFDVAGIQLNGFNNIQITNCEIGPSALPPVNGRYLHARTLLRRYRHLVDNYGDEALLFAHRDDTIASTVRQYVDELIEEMDIVYRYVLYGVIPQSSQWNKARELFLNPSSYQHGDGGVVYGILLNSRGGAVMGFGNAPSQSVNAAIANVSIHDLGIAPIEKLKFKTDPVGGATRGPVADVFDMMKVSDRWGEMSDVLMAKYVGTAYSDVQIALSLFEESWYVLDHTCFDEGIIDWTVNGTPFSEDTVHGGCNTDIQLHINKGVIGLRIDNVVGFTVNQIQIRDLQNTGELGAETICGAYTQGNAHQDPLITAGYTGTEGYGITITQSTDGSIDGAIIDGIETFYGSCNGIALFKDSSVTFNDIVVSNIVAGSQLEVARDLRPYQAYLPNKIPRACSVFDNEYNTEYVIGVDGVHAHDINGALICNKADGDLIGECDESNCIATYDASYFDELAQLSQEEFLQLYAAKYNDDNYLSWSWWIVAFVVLTICILYYYRSSSSLAKKYDNGNHEYTPLLN